MRGRIDSSANVDRWSRHDWWGVVLDTAEPSLLAHFYSDLLGWEISHESETGAALGPADGVAYLAVQLAEHYVPPVWPPEPGVQQMMMHLDFEVSDLEAAVAHAVELGAEIADFQPQDDVRVLRDPAGHPFCLYT